MYIFKQAKVYIFILTFIADRFHFIRWMYWSMDRVRIRVQKEWSDYDRKKVKKMRYVFWKKSENLTEEDKWYLERYCKMSNDLKIAYETKEKFCRWFENAKLEKDVLKTKKDLDKLQEDIQRTNLPELIRGGKTLKNWEFEIINSFVFPYSNGFVEGLNNRTKVIKRNAYGFRRFERLRAKVLLTHEYKNIGNFLV